MGENIALVLRALNLGDLLVAVPALRALRRSRPGHRIVLAAPRELAPLVDLVDAVDELLPTRDPASLHWQGPPPELVVNLHGTGPQSHDALDALGPRSRVGFRRPGWHGPAWEEVARRHPHERERWCALLEYHGMPADAGELHLTAAPCPCSGAAVVVHPGARYGAKRWPTERFGRLAAALERGGGPVFVTGSAAERDLARTVAALAGLGDSRVLAGHTDLAQLCALVAGAALVVSGDTGIAHLATAFGTPSVALFGPVDPAQWGPPPVGPHVALTDATARRGDPFAADPDPALLAVQVGEVARAASTVQAPATGCRGSPGCRGAGPGMTGP